MSGTDREQTPPPSDEPDTKPGTGDPLVPGAPRPVDGPVAKPPAEASTPADRKDLADAKGDAAKTATPASAPATAPVTAPAPAPDASTTPAKSATPAKRETPPSGTPASAAAKDAAKPSPTPTPAASPTSAITPAADASAEAKPKPASTLAKSAFGGVMPLPKAAIPKPPPIAKRAEETGIQIRVFGQTDVGLVREHNEDNFLIADLTRGDRTVGPGSQPPAEAPEGETTGYHVGDVGLLLAVCDGMGGAAAGEVASQMAVDTVFEIMQEGGKPSDRDDFARRLVRAIEEAGARIFSAAKLDRTRRGMGTTATVGGLIDKVLFVGQVGDSRAYVLRDGQFNLITKDQSLVNQLIEAGQLTEEEAEAFEHSNIILQALGTSEEVQVDLTFLEMRRGDRMMMCSDGLSGLVHADMIRDVLERNEEPAECCRILVDMARTGGGHDNITVIVADFDGNDLPPPTERDMVAYQPYPLPPAEDDRVSLPPRDVTIKGGGPKPGADVKREPRHGYSRELTPEARSMRAWWIAVVLVIAVVAAAVALAVSNPGRPDEGRNEAMRGVTSAVAAIQPPREVEDDLVELIPVHVRTDVGDAELIVDGELHGPFQDGEVTVRLPPGAYRFEARAGGASVASTLVTVATGHGPFDIVLAMPRGAAQTVVDAGALVRQSGGQTRRSGATARRGSGHEDTQPSPPDQGHSPIPPNPYE